LRAAERMEEGERDGACAPSRAGGLLVPDMAGLSEPARNCDRSAYIVAA